MRDNSIHKVDLPCTLALLLFLYSAYFHGLFAQDASSAIPATKPAAQIELSAIGYHEASDRDLLSEDEPNLSLDFVDADHVLFTFNPKKLLARLPGCSPDHEDRLMHAAVLQISSGQVVNQKG